MSKQRGENSPKQIKGVLPGPKMAPTNLVISHRLREILNEKCNLVDVVGKTGAQRFTLGEFGIQAMANANNPQDAWFWPGQQVVACCKGRKLRNGRAYEIMHLGSSHVVIRAEEEEPIQLKRGEFFRCLRLKYAVTYASAQGITVGGLLALHDTAHAHFDWRKLYVGLSRATGKNKVIVY